MATAHKAEQLRTFQQGESRMVYAVDSTANDEVVYFDPSIPPEQYDAFRKRTREDLRCIVPECRARLRAYFRTNKRDGYGHEPGTAAEHQGESEWHEQGKLRIRDWLNGKYGNTLEVILEKDSSDHKHRPDITVISRATGRRVAIEIQYSSLTPEKWRKRYDGLAARYDAQVWFLGHKGPHISARNGAFKFTTLPLAMVEHGCIPVWLNPVDGLVLTAWSEVNRVKPLPPSTPTAEDYEIVPLEDCSFGSGGRFITAALERIEEKERWLHKQQQLRQRRAAEAAERALLTWEGSEDRAWILQRHDDTLPAFVAEPATEADLATAAWSRLTVEHWRTLIYRTTAELAPGEWIKFEDLLQTLRPATVSHMPGAAFSALRGFVEQLAANDLVLYELEYWRPNPYGRPPRRTNRIDRIRNRLPFATTAPSVEEPIPPIKEEIASTAAPVEFEGPVQKLAAPWWAPVPSPGAESVFRPVALQEPPRQQPMDPAPTPTDRASRGRRFFGLLPPRKPR